MNLFQLHLLSGVLLLGQLAVATAGASTARTDWEIACNIRSDKFDYVLPDAMRDNGIDMWIVIDKGRGTEPLSRDFGDASSNGNGVFVFTDRGGDRIERASFGRGIDEVRDCGVYDIVGDPSEVADFVREREPRAIGVNFTTDTELYPREGRHLSNGISHTDFANLQAALGEPYASRLVSAERLIAHFRGRRVALELIEFSKIAEITRTLLDRALSNEVVTPGVTTQGDVMWWLDEQRVQLGLESGWEATVYISPPDGIEYGNTHRVIQRGDVVQIDYGIGRNNFFTDVKRFAYVLRDGEEALPAWVETAFDNSRTVRRMIRRNVVSGGSGRDKLNALKQAVADLGFVYTEAELPSDVEGVEVNIGMHPAGNLGHDAGGALFEIYPVRMDYEIQPYSIISLEFIVFTPTDEWGGNKVPVNIEENAVITPHGIEWLHVPQDHPLLIR
ncbi:MAG: M24 family metallopeptidase [Rhodospirillaceae bacterium]|nr:M24 family metallopeptidase [Rhodospirillaceae bacterium]MDE0361422.1 M24 family metallopeptidase [Rhodospirillaceae bacterium]